jgi:hypothetical protein
MGEVAARESSIAGSQVRNRASKSPTTNCQSQISELQDRAPKSKKANCESRIAGRQVEE